MSDITTIIFSLISWERIKYVLTAALILFALWIGRSAIKSLKRWWWRRRLKHEQLNLSRFSFHGVTANIEVLDAVLGNLRQGYRDELIVLGTPNQYKPLGEILAHQPDGAMSQLQATFETNREKWINVAKAGGKSIWDNHDLIGFNRISILRHGEDEHNHIHINSARTSYFDHRAIADCFKEMTDEQQRAVLAAHRYGSDVFGRIAAVSAALVTSEGKLLFPRRSPILTSDPGMITCGINEALKVSDAQQKGALSVPKRAILRGLDEEFGINLPSELLDRVHVWALVLHTTPFEWYFYGTVDLRDCGSEYSAAQLQQNMLTRRARDGFEHDGVSVVEFELDKLLTFIISHRNEITEYGATLPILAALFDGQSKLPLLQQVRALISARRP